MKKVATAKRIVRLITALAIMAVLAIPALAEMNQEELAKAAQNPVANMISLPLQNNTNFGIDPHDRTQNVLNIQPVAPFNL